MLINRLSSFDYNIIDPSQEEHLINFDQKDYIRKADIFIALIIDYSPNIFLELGYAIGIGKNVLIIADPNIELPSDIRTINYIRLDYISNKFIHDILSYIESINIKKKKSFAKEKNPFQLLDKSIKDVHYLESIDNNEFENIVFEAFVAEDYKIERADSKYDIGYDFIVYNFKGFAKTVVELKKYSKNSKVSLGKVQQLLGAIISKNANSGILVATTDFTGSAKDFTQRTNLALETKIHLWKLEDLIREIKR